MRCFERQNSNHWVGLVAVLFLSTIAWADSGTLTPEQEDRVDSLFQNWDRSDSPGVALGIVKDGNLIYSKGYGLADLEHDVPIDASTVFYMASVSKHFVTLCILLLSASTL